MRFSCIFCTSFPVIRSDDKGRGEGSSLLLTLARKGRGVGRGEGSSLLLTLAISWKGRGVKSALDSCYIFTGQGQATVICLCISFDVEKQVLF